MAYGLLAFGTHRLRLVLYRSMALALTNIPKEGLKAQNLYYQISMALALTNLAKEGLKAHNLYYQISMALKSHTR